MNRDRKSGWLWSMLWPWRKASVRTMSRNGRLQRLPQLSTETELGSGDSYEIEQCTTQWLRIAQWAHLWRPE